VSIQRAIADGNEQQEDKEQGKGVVPFSEEQMAAIHALIQQTNTSMSSESPLSTGKG